MSFYESDFFKNDFFKNDTFKGTPKGELSKVVPIQKPKKKRKKKES